MWVDHYSLFVMCMPMNLKLSTFGVHITDKLKCQGFNLRLESGVGAELRFWMGIEWELRMGLRMRVGLEAGDGARFGF